MSKSLKRKAPATGYDCIKNPKLRKSASTSKANSAIDIRKDIETEVYNVSSTRKTKVKLEEAASPENEELRKSARTSELNSTPNSAVDIKKDIAREICNSPSKQKAKVKVEEPAASENPKLRQSRSISKVNSAQNGVIHIKKDIETEISNLSTKQITKVKLKEAAVPKVKTKIKKTKSEALDSNMCSDSVSDSNYKFLWSDYVLLSMWGNIDEYLAQNIIQLFEDGNTIPFIARYRKNIIGDLSIEELKDVRDKYAEINEIKDKAVSVIKNLTKQGQLNSSLQKSILGSTSIEEIEFIYAPFKPASKKTLAARAKALGLEDVAMDIINDSKVVNLQLYVKSGVDGLQDIESVEQGIVHIIAAYIATDLQVLTFLRDLRSVEHFEIESKKLASSKAQMKVKKDKEVKIVDETKFEQYFDYVNNVKFIKPHQVLAINRGEAQKVLSVKIIIPESVFKKFSNYCYNRWTKYGFINAKRKELIERALQDSYTRLVQPLISREIRAELKQKAEKASIEVFTQNLKQLLLTVPIKGRRILGIDPGFTNGCKMGLISETGTVLAYETVYPHTKRDFNHQRSNAILTEMLTEHKCNLIAIGSGTACRETETWISDLIAAKQFRTLDIQYIIVDENGASIYSCSEEARKEFPDLDPNIISAVSLARRVQEPLAEFVKVEPKHLGVGMYQHDMTKKNLEDALAEVVSECVSFVGVDLNTASQCLLRRVAGLSDKKAADIIAYRNSNGYFKSRQEIMKVNRIGKKIFEQCAGFLRVGPIRKDHALAFYMQPGTNKLDCTEIHPESYGAATNLINMIKLDLLDIGTESFISEFKLKSRTISANAFCTKFKIEAETLALITQTLAKPLNYDFRSELSNVPLFRKGITSMDALEFGTILTGRVQNCTHFGCFMDIGVGCNGLLHTSQYKGLKFQVGDQVQVKILSVDVAKKRIGLEALKKIR